MDVHHFYEVFKPLLFVYGVLTPVVVITRFFLNRKKEIVYTLTDHRGYKIAVTLDFKMSSAAGDRPASSGVQDRTLATRRLQSCIPAW